MIEKRSQPLSRTRFLDGLRGLAALFVVAHHATEWLHPGYQYGIRLHPERYGLLARAAYVAAYPFHFGRGAVFFFFVLSGFVIHLRYARLAANRTVATHATIKLPSSAQFGPFLYRRARRLYPPLLAAIIITWAIDSFGARLGYSIYFSHTPYPLLNSTIGHDHTVRTLIGNVLFVMNQIVPVWGSDGPLWSLKYEWWFYVLYPFLWPLLRSSPWPATIVVIGVALTAALTPPFGGTAVELFRDVAKFMPIWWLGGLLAEVYAGRITVRFSQLVPLVAFLPVAAFLSSRGGWEATADRLWSLGFAGVIAAGFAGEKDGLHIRLLGRLSPLGDCSYTLYVIHAPLLVLVSGWLMSCSSSGELFPSFVPAAAASLAVVPVAYLLHFAVERPFVGHRRVRTPTSSTDNLIVSKGPA